MRICLRWEHATAANWWEGIERQHTDVVADILWDMVFDRRGLRAATPRLTRGWEKRCAIPLSLSLATFFVNLLKFCPRICRAVVLFKIAWFYYFLNKQLFAQKYVCSVIDTTLLFSPNIEIIIAQNWKLLLVTTLPNSCIYICLM